tara:strand:- start:1088 stop:2920 length:1833 start_codon:yes stop_codon:yes gene_type:complete
MKKSLPPRSFVQPPQVPAVNPSPSKGAFKASTFMVLMSIFGIVGTSSLAWFVWYLVEDWKTAESQLNEAVAGLGESPEAITEAKDFHQFFTTVVVDALVKAETDVKPFAESPSNPTVVDYAKALSRFEATSGLLEYASDRFASTLAQREEFDEDWPGWRQDTNETLSQTLQYSQALKVFLKTDSKDADWVKASSNFTTSSYRLRALVKKLKQKAEKLESNYNAEKQKFENEFNPEDKKGVSQLMVSFAVIGCVFVPLFFAWSTYRIVAHPIHLLAVAAARSLDEGKPFEMKETGPEEVRSLTRRLGSLVQGLEDRVLQRTEELHTKAVQLEKEINQRRELETQLVFAQKMEAVGQLAAGIAHEVNTPSQYVCDNLRFLQDAVSDLLVAVAPENSEGEQPEKPDAEELEFLSENAPEAVDQALQGMERITSIVKSMKNFAYRDANSEKKPQDLNQAIQATIVVATNEWKYHAELQTDLDPNLPFVPCNIGEINQVVLNLIVNAAHAIRDANPDGVKGLIQLATKQYEDFVVITIKDNGGGIPEEVQTRVFEPFFTTKDVGVGTGQGLAIAHNVITKSHTGHLWFETELGTGTTFFIRLPLQVVQEPAEAQS